MNQLFPTDSAQQIITAFLALLTDNAYVIMQVFGFFIAVAFVVSLLGGGLRGNFGKSANWSDDNESDYQASEDRYNR